MKKWMVVLIGVVLVATTLTGCETIRGLGEDIQNTGDNIWDAMNKDK